jgi:hypothetical protein
MPNLHLFGMLFPVGANGAIQKPASLPGTVTGTFAGGVAQIRIVAPLGAHDVVLDLRIRMQASGPNDFVPAPGVHPQVPNAQFRVVDTGTAVALPFHVAMGAVEVTDTVGTVETVGGEVSLRLPATLFVRGNGLPVTLESGGGGAVLNLSAQPTLTLRASSLRATTAGVLDVFDPINFIAVPTPLLDTAHSSRDVVFPLIAGANAPRLVFDHAAARPLMLHADLRDRTQALAAGNEVFAPLAVTGHALHVELGRNVSGAFVQRIAAEPANGSGLTLHAFGYSGRRNEHAMFSIGVPLPLHARVGTQQRPASLLIAPDFGDAAPLAVANAGGDVLHGMVAAHEFRPDAQGALFCRPDERRAGTPGGFAIDPGIVSEHTTPWLRFGATAGMSMRHAKAGRAFREAGAISRLDFHGNDVALPLLPKECFQGAPDIQTSHYGALGAVYDTHTHALQKATHETLLDEGPAGPPTVRIAELFSPKLIVDLADTTARREADIRLRTHKVVLDYKVATVTIDIGGDAPPDYVVIRDGSVLGGAFTFELDSQSHGKVRGKPTSTVLGIAKISRQFTLEDIFARENIGPADIGNVPIDHFDETVRSAGWTGLMLFATLLDFSEMGVLKGLLPEDALKLDYVAVTPEKSAGRFSVNSRVKWTNPNPPDAPARPAVNEATFRMNSLEAAWNDSQLVYFHAEAEAKFDSFFGVDFNQPGSTNPLPQLAIVGSFEAKTGEIRFLGKLAQPLELLPADFGGFGPIKQARVRSAEIISTPTDHGRETAVSIDGGLDLRSFGFGGEDWFTLGDLPSIDFAGLQIVLPKPDLAPIWGAIRYPSLALRSKSSPFRFGFFELKLQRIAVDWNGIRDFDWGSLLDINSVGGKDQWLRNFRFDLRLELMKLPELAAKSIDRLILDFTIAFGLRAGQSRFSLDDMQVSVGAVGFDRLRLDLLRFLELSCDHVELKNENGVKRLALVNVVLRILGQTFVDGLTFLLFSSKDGEGFLGFMPTGSDDVQTEGALAVYWILAGHNVSLRSVGDDLARKLLSIDAPTVQGDNVAIRKLINAAVTDPALIKFESPLHGGGWVFASGFDFFGLFQGKFLFQDRTYYGGVLRGGLFDEWFGSGFAISVLYTRGARPEQDSLYAALRVPMVQTGTFTFMGGVIALEIVMNGGFTLDVGFPWLQPSGARLWDHALGAIVTPFQGSGGFYVRKYNQTSIVKNNNGEGVLFAGGYAVQIGLGAGFGGGVFHVWATIGLYAIVEGELYFEKLTGDRVGLRGLALIGAVGILGRAGGELNWWIISARVEIMISAETRLELRWGRFLPDPADPPGGPIHVTAEFIVYARASAEACIGSGWFRVCKSIGVELPMRFGYSFQIGG